MTPTLIFSAAMTVPFALSGQCSFSGNRRKTKVAESLLVRELECDLAAKSRRQRDRLVRPEREIGAERQPHTAVRRLGDSGNAREKAQDRIIVIWIEGWNADAQHFGGNALPSEPESP